MHGTRATDAFHLGQSDLNFNRTGSMKLKISSVQRDAFYEQFEDRLDAIDDIRRAVEQGKFEVAQKLARAYSDDLEFVCTDLGWGEHLGGEIELKTSPVVLSRIFDRIGELAAGMENGEQAQAAAVLDLEKRNRILVETCRWGLERIGEEAA